MGKINIHVEYASTVMQETILVLHKGQDESDLRDMAALYNKSLVDFNATNAPSSSVETMFSLYS